MKKCFASHYLYHPVHQFQKQVIVELENGIYIRSYPLSEEVHSVIWLGGIIILSHQTDLKINGNINFNFNDLIISISSEMKGLSLYAYYLNNLDFRNYTLSSDTLLKRLI